MFTYDSGILTIERDGVSLGSRTDASRASPRSTRCHRRGRRRAPITVSSGHYPWKSTPLARLWMERGTHAAQRIVDDGQPSRRVPRSARPRDARERYRRERVVGLGATSTLAQGCGSRGDDGRVVQSARRGTCKSHAWITTPPEQTRGGTTRQRIRNPQVRRHETTSCRTGSRPAAGIITAGAFEILHARYRACGISAEREQGAQGQGLSMRMHCCAAITMDSSASCSATPARLESTRRRSWYNGSAENAVQSAAFNLNTEVTLSMRSDGTNLRCRRERN